jgi:hypothetical protein
MRRILRNAIICAQFTFLKIPLIPTKLHKRSYGYVFFHH